MVLLQALDKKSGRVQAVNLTVVPILGVSDKSTTLLEENRIAIIVKTTAGDCCQLKGQSSFQ
jgi:hypothetical protein